MGRMGLPAAVPLAVILGAHAASAFLAGPALSLRGRTASATLTGGRGGASARTAAAGLGRPGAPEGRRAAPLGLRCAADAGAFAKWLEDNGAKLACKVAEGSSGRGLIAANKLKAGEEVCSIPIKLMLTEETAGAALGSKAADLDAETAIALQLIKEKAEGSKSFFAPWIEMLPTRETLDVPLFWSEEQRDLLGGSKVEEDTAELKTALREEFDQLVGSGWDKIVPALTLEEYEWATSIVSSRAHDTPKLQGGVALAPLVDFPEHSTTQGGKIELVYEGMFREPRLKFSAGAATGPGGRLCVDYKASNNDLVFKRGLADLKVIAGSYDLDFSVSPMDKFRDDKEDILELNGYTTAQSFKLDSEEEEPEDYEMLAYLRLVCLSRTDAFLLESVFRSEVWGFMQLPVSKDNEKLMLDTLIGYCEGALEGYESSDGEDAAAQNDEGRPLRVRLAAAAKLAEKKALKKALNLYSEDLELMDQKEYYQERRLRELNLDRPLDESEIVDPDQPIRNYPSDY